MARTLETLLVIGLFLGSCKGDGWGSQSGLNQDSRSRNQGSSNAASSWSQSSGGGGLFGGGGRFGGFRR